VCSENLKTGVVGVDYHAMGITWERWVLSGVDSKYGKNSSQYKMTGGVRKSERKKRKTTTAQ